MEAIEEKETYKLIKATSVPLGKQILPVQWVFTHKLDTADFLQRFKARVCVRGDLQDITEVDVNKIFDFLPSRRKTRAFNGHLPSQQTAHPGRWYIASRNAKCQIVLSDSRDPRITYTIAVVLI